MTERPLWATDDEALVDMAGYFLFHWPAEGFTEIVPCWFLGLYERGDVFGKEAKA